MRVPLVLCLTAALAACVTRSNEVQPLVTDASMFSAMGCNALYDESDRVQERAARVAYSVDERAGTNIVALGMGISVFWPALLAMRPAGPDADELARLKGRDEAVRAALAAKDCPPAPAQMPPDRMATLPFALGERLVYEERALAGGPARELGLRVTALRRGEIEFGVDPPRSDTTPQRWLQDTFGNLPQRPDITGWVHWRRLLQPDLALGTVLAGEIVGGEGEVPGRVRGQVIALGVQTSLGRPFDAAVIELFGDVPHNDHSTRLTGVMVIDRKSGVLLRLELRSGNPEFALRRTLVRIEPAPPAQG
ncbi:MAG: hypothetical protein OEU94_03285 [Aquincola sp.]|nr:hypothetical protein [Aquincola sp.]